MIKTIDECVKGNAKFSRKNNQGHHYCSLELNFDCYSVSDNNFVPDGNGVDRPICRLKVELEKPVTSNTSKGFLSRLYQK
jgi:hypothetical protein